jgi:lysophospholipase L1-like esterase
MTQLLILFTILLLNLSCSDTKIDKSDIQAYRYLALGDSYTIGEGVAVNERWPVLLTDSLLSSGIKINNTLIIARTGWTTAELKGGIVQANPEGPFDLVSLLIGVNNQYRGESRGYTPEGYRQEFTELLEMAVEFAGGKPERVFVVSIPDYGVTPFVKEENKEKVSAEIDIYNAINLEISNSLGIKYFDITPLSRLAANDNTLLAGDKLHPSGKMYKSWVDMMVSEIYLLLTKKEKSLPASQ